MSGKGGLPALTLLVLVIAGLLSTIGGSIVAAVTDPSVLSWSLIGLGGVFFVTCLVVVYREDRRN